MTTVPAQRPATPPPVEVWADRLVAARTGRAGTGLAAGLPAAVADCLAAGAGAGAAATEAAYALGALRAVQGHGAVTVVEDVLALRPLLAGGGTPEEVGRLQQVLDDVLVAAVAAHDGERTDVPAGTRDPLSGLLHGPVFAEVLDREVAAAARDGAPSVLLVDVDGLADYHEQAGRLAADLLLVRIAQLLVECSRRSDVLARLDDARLALLLPHTDKLRALVVARRVLSRARTSEQLAPEVAPVSLRLGLGWVDQPRDRAQVLGAAGAALVRAAASPGHVLEVSRPEDAP